MVMYPPGAFVDTLSKVTESDLVKPFIDIHRLGYINEVQAWVVQCSFINEIWEQPIAVLRYDGCRLVSNSVL
jgi:hypothetical protein